MLPGTCTFLTANVNMRMAQSNGVNVTNETGTLLLSGHKKFPGEDLA